MNELTLIYGCFALLLGGYVFWCGRFWGAVVFIPLAIISHLALSELMSRPKPINLEWLRNDPTAQVVAYTFDEGAAIYIWLAFPAMKEPRAYRLPWSIETAKALREAFDGAGDRGVEMPTPFQKSWEDRRDHPFYPMPQPKLPDKGGQETPKEYKLPGGDA